MAFPKPISVEDIINGRDFSDTEAPVNDGQIELISPQRQCKECGLIKSLNGFRRHSARCRECLKVKCFYEMDGVACNIILSDERSLQRHISTVHEKQKPHQCPNCLFKCSQKGNLRHHVCRNPNDGCGYKTEDVYQREVESETGGQMTKCNGGVVDVVSCIEVIEIKHWIRWKDAIGEVIVYGLDFPEKRKRIHFFGQRPDERTYNYIRSVCKKLEIFVTETKVVYKKYDVYGIVGGKTPEREPILQALEESRSDQQRRQSLERKCEINIDRKTLPSNSGSSESDDNVVL
jgi:hypothetical protein